MHQYYQMLASHLNKTNWILQMINLQQILDFDYPQALDVFLYLPCYKLALAWFL